MRHLRAAAVGLAATLGAYASALVVEHFAHLHVDTVIQAVVLALTAARAQRRMDGTDRLLGLAVLPLATLAASAVRYVMADHAYAGFALFVVAVPATVWVRRFGIRATRAGTLAVLPFVALLITQGPVMAPVTGRTALWSAVIALIAGVWVAALQTVLARDEPPAPQAPPKPSARRIRPSTRMALQMAAALAAAFVAGHLLWPDHWPWPVLTAFLVCSGARSRGDVLVKGVQRTVGAAAGTVVATLVAGSFGPRADAAVVLIFVVLAVASWLREAAYAYWACGVTAALSLLYGWFGEASGDLLRTRLAGIALGGLLGVGASWFVLPIRTRDVLRRRAADALAALGPVLSPGTDARDAEDFTRAVELLEQIVPALRARAPLSARRLSGRTRGVEVVEEIRACAAPAVTLSAAYPDPVPAEVDALSAQVSRNLIAVRKTLGRRPGVQFRPAVRPPSTAPAVTALLDIDDHLSRLVVLLDSGSER
ncbi:FUSC family protein [Actinomadura rupiterrae]|uniref:FUSC family protein n=1 Tax=Actinomadura rupiterrae TaxID=559627 RepID=UPI0020A351CA|nr:FUSC family protein [Actinomadura rupiterrae]MCP2342263.1 hypothetical protein [Actinomadura rupiterrae]